MKLCVLNRPCGPSLCIWFHISGSLNPELFANGWCAIRKVCVRCVHGRLAVFSFRPDPHTQLSRSLFQNAPPAPKPANDACVDWSMSVSSLLFSNLLLLQPAPFHTSGNGSQQKERKNHSRLDYTIEIRLLSIECVSLIGQYTLKCQPGTALYTNFMLAL